MSPRVAPTQGCVVAGLVRKAAAHVVRHDLHIVDDARDLVHLRAADEFRRGADRDGEQVVAERLAQGLQQKGEGFAVRRIRIDARQVAAGVFPIDVDAVQAVFVDGPAAAAGEGPAALRGPGHLGKAARAPAADREHDVYVRIPCAELRQKVQVRELFQG